MVAYNNVIARGEVPMSEDFASQIIDNAKDGSAALTLFRRATVSKAQQRFPVLSALPTAYWVNGDTGLKQTTEVNWANKYINIEELAAIVPVPENVLDDSDFDIWGEVRPKLETALARALDDAVFFGTNAPASFPTNVRAASIAAGNTVTAPTVAVPGTGGFMGTLDEVLNVLEDDGYDPTGYVAARGIRRALRSARSTYGERLDRDRVSAGLDEIDGDHITYAMRGMWPLPVGAGVKGVLGFAGDWSQFVLGVRKDITYKVLTEAVIQDGAGAIQYNLAQQDMVALRVTFRAGWQVANPLNYDKAVEANRYPAAVIESQATS